MLTLRQAFEIEKPTKRQKTLLAVPVYVRDTFGEAWSIPQGTLSHLIIVNWLTIGGHNAAVVPLDICRAPDDSSLWRQDPWPPASKIPAPTTPGPVCSFLVNLPHWGLMYDWSRSHYTERFNEWKRSLAPPERKRTRKPKEEVPAAKPARVNPFG